MPGKPNFAEANAFDGPGPETINSRLVRCTAEQVAWCSMRSVNLICIVCARRTSAVLGPPVVWHVTQPKHTLHEFCTW